jgi:predicted small lipoprotein YifL
MEARTFSVGPLSENVRAPVCVVLLAAALAAGCGKKGPPLPPLVKLPAPPADFTAQRRGSTVDLHFIVPGTNTDGTRPANVERVEVYGFTGPATVTDDQLLKHGTKVASLRTKTPRDPNQTIEADEPQDEIEPPEGPGLDQGALARVEEELTATAMGPADLSNDTGKRPAPTVDSDASRPLLGPPATAASRTYVGVGVNNRGRRGPISGRVTVPLVPPPARPPTPLVSYNETTVTVTWTAGDTASLPQKPAGGPSADVLPSKPIGPALPPIAYNVYEVSPADAEPGSSRTPRAPAETRLTKTPIPDAHFSDARIEWGAERCYVVRAVETVGSLTLESDAAPPACKRLVDTFPPAAPKGLTAVATEGTINLIWQPNDEKDLNGYLVLRAVAPGEKLSPVTSSPIQGTTFKDAVQPSVRYVYAVVAVDKAGNTSAPSNAVEEMAR